MKISLARLAAILLATAGLAAPAASQCLDAILSLPNPKGNDHFGEALDRVGNRILVGAPYRASKKGRAYVFERQGGVWIRTAKLEASSPGIFFGSALDLDVDRLAVSDSVEATPSIVPSVYLFEYQGGGWVQSDRLLSPAGTDQIFGADLTLQGDRLVVGANAAAFTSNLGSVYVYERAAGVWTLDAELQPPVSQVGDEYGFSVDLDGDRIVVGAYLRDTAAGPNAGQVYVFEKGPNGWALQQVVEAVQPAADQWFGTRVDVDGGRLLIQAQRGDTACGGSLPCDRGGVYVWEYDGVSWSEVERIEPGDTDVSSAFGAGISLSGDVAAVRSTFSSTYPRTYVVKRESSGWRELFPLSVGSHSNKVTSNSILLQGGCFGGCVYVYDLLGPVGANYCSTPANSTGFSGRMHATGTDNVGRNCMTIAADRLPPQQSGYFLLAPNAGFVANPGGSQGNLCLGAGIGRFDAQVRKTGGLGSFSIFVDLTDVPAGPGFVMQGSTWYFQAWYRDVNPGPTSNFTDGLSILFL